jgi:hypothetical protein
MPEGPTPAAPVGGPLEGMFRVKRDRHENPGLRPTDRHPRGILHREAERLGGLEVVVDCSTGKSAGLAYLFSFAQLLGAVLCTWCEVGRALYG